MISPFLDALGADGPSADRAGKMDLYGRFVGSWELDVMQIADDGRKRRRPGEWHFGWALEGRAIQDVWIVPPRGALRDGDAAARFNSYGTTLRVYDPDIDAWRIQWTDGDAEFSEHDRPRAGRKHRSARNAAGRRPGPLELFGHHAGFISLARRNLQRSGGDVAAQR